MRLRLSLARTSRTYDRSPLWDPDPAHRVRLQPRRGHSGDSHVEEEQAIPRGADRRGREVLSAGLRWPPRRRSHAAQRRRLRVGHVAPTSPDCRSQRAIEDYASGQLPLPPPHMGEPRPHDRHAADGRGSQPRARRHADGRETLRASRAVVYQRRDPRWRPTIRIQGGAEGRPNRRRIRSKRRCAYKPILEFKSFPSTTTKAFTSSRARFSNFSRNRKLRQRWLRGPANLLYRTRTEWRRRIKRPLLQPVV